MKCITCNERCGYGHVRYFAVPGHIIVPNSYVLCDTHKDHEYRFDDIYNNDGSRKSIKKTVVPVID